MSYLAIIFVAILTYLLPLTWYPHDGALHVYFLDCGQGDSIYIRTPEGGDILIDTCPDGAITTTEVKKYIPPFDSSIDMIFLTHPHKDHIGGLGTLLKEFHVGRIILPTYTMESLSSDLHAQLSAQMIPTFSASAEHDITFGSVTFDILFPFDQEESFYIDENNSSLVMKLLYNNITLLCTGDAEEKLETLLLEKGVNLRSTYLKGGHHGSKSSTTPPFLQAVHPDAAIYLNGKNNTFGHPHKETLELLEKEQIPVYNTSIDGTVHLRCDLSSCTLTSEHHYERAPTPALY